LRSLHSGTRHNLSHTYKLPQHIMCAASARSPHLLLLDLRAIAADGSAISKSEASKNLKAISTCSRMPYRAKWFRTPLGAFLSAYRFFAVVALMQSILAAVRTFTIGFNDKRYNEADQAASRDHLGTDHTELVVSPQSRATRSSLPDIMMSPRRFLTDPTFLVSELARPLLPSAYRHVR